jgi:hypothetical protein
MIVMGLWVDILAVVMEGGEQWRWGERERKRKRGEQGK